MRLLTAFAAALVAIAGCSSPPPNNTSGGGGGEDDDSSSETEGPDNTIYEIRDGDIPLGESVTLRDVVVTTPVAATRNAVFIAEPEGGENSGIYVSLAEGIAEDIALLPGVGVTITGVYEEHFGRSQVAVSSLADIEIGDPIPAPDPVVLAPADIATSGPLSERYEGVVVRVEDVTVTDPDLGFGEFSISGGLIVDDFFFTPGTEPMPYEGLELRSITGPLVFAYDASKLAPRDFADLDGWYGGTGDSDGGTGGAGETDGSTGSGSTGSGSTGATDGSTGTTS